jgi:Putative quorum-sensing-regulated virulence factor
MQYPMMIYEPRPTINFGKYSGRALTDIPSGYLDWLLSKSFLRPKPRKFVEAEMNRRPEAGEYANREQAAADRRAKLRKESIERRRLREADRRRRSLFAI